MTDLPETARAALESLRDEIVALARRYRDNVTRYAQDAAHHRAERDEQRDRANTLDARCIELREEVDGAKADAGLARQILSAAEQAVDEARKRLAALRASTAGAMKSAMLERDGLRHELAEQRAKVEGQRKVIADLRARIDPVSDEAIVAEVDAVLTEMGNIAESDWSTGEKHTHLRAQRRELLLLMRRSEPVSPVPTDVREALAALAHEQWSGWMRYMLPKLVPNDWTERWRRQMDTPYAELSESEKESDRKEADRVLVLVPDLGAANTALLSSNYEIAEKVVRLKAEIGRLRAAQLEPLRELWAWIGVNILPLEASDSVRDEIQRRIAALGGEEASE